LTRRKTEAERRKWARLPLAIPVFVRSRDQDGKEFLEFATAWNVSAGGALIAVRRSLRLSSQVLLEIPSAPATTAPSRAKASSRLQAQTKWVTHTEGYHLVGLKFSHPLLNHPSPQSVRRRKVASSL
jgi:PilZ domain